MLVTGKGAVGRVPSFSVGTAEEILEIEQTRHSSRELDGHSGQLDH